ncbi:NADH-quinone oxidoreductase subunit NuoH [Salinispora arenicola]|uniref:NADH-quinone oxidoreductase subunit H n=2 Tax=Salinispora arenicola TaxID=168697 RepID=A0A542XLV6_SALAC|nr:NADH-quinone oxidoreductase subunit NuoH [Salinispora arenicola]MCN0152874.1 NADH-quinone oxidoreductase subunit NuoH [Salinispora arenicola]NIL41530.1 NADH-quinone oxidoreductase subunit NuoH [Salinispora arenicola]NIL57826.1 NADH-quinone oxidoreductase subunit NuoH [Salinispora arenicola]NIL63216.1 NADH-quinone oxidoreductase subunit NuoH [Salinispora arenicola]TQL36822.1 NADH dehydrogenase subunit H [Salinispora arenicola]
MTFLAQEPTLADFGRDPWWLILIKVVFAFAFGLVATLLGVWFERRVVGRMAVRPGPNQLGPFGLLQTLADGVKMAFKEDILPRSADKVVYFFAPVISVVCAVTALSVMPFGPMVSIFGHQTPLQVTDVSVAVLLVLACSSMAVYGVVLAGWASGSTYPLLGGLRSSAQLISYEIALGLSVVAVFMLSGTMSTSGIVAAQGERPQVEFFGLDVSAPGWYAILLFPSFVIFFIAIVGETNRAPFDLPEAESELVAGFMTEYSSLKFALIMLSEYVAMVTMSAFTVTLFLGGWRAPWPLSIWDGANSGWWPMLWFFGKVLALVFVFVWLRGTLPRLRYDQFMRLGWKVLLPLNLLWILVLAGWLKTQGWERADRLIAYGAVAGVVLIVTLIWPSRKPAAKPTLAEEVSNRPYGSFPLPPLDLQVPPSPRTQRIVAEREPANLTTGTDSREV